MTQYLSGEEILYIHHQIIETVGGSHGVRDMNLFLSTVERPQSNIFGEEQFPTVFAKAGAYLENFAQYQMFVDGNKRTGLATAARFLFINNFVFTATNKEVEEFVMKVATKEVELVEIAEWLERHSKPIKNS